jgi:hypothetical protein
MAWSAETPIIVTPTETEKAESDVCNSDPCIRQSCDWLHDSQDCQEEARQKLVEDSCYKCLVEGFGHCAVRGIDPGCESRKAASRAGLSAAVQSCEVAKAARNAAYDAAHEACVAASMARNVACESKKAACEASKEQSK